VFFEVGYALPKFPWEQYLWHFIAISTKKRNICSFHVMSSQDYVKSGLINIPFLINLLLLLLPFFCNLKTGGPPGPKNVLAGHD